MSTETRTPRSRGGHRRHLPAAVAPVGGTSPTADPAVEAPGERPSDGVRARDGLRSTLGVLGEGTR